MEGIPYTVETRPDTGLTNPKVGIWLFLASEVMLFGSLFSSYVLLRSGAEFWPVQSEIVNIPLATLNTAILISSSVTMVMAWATLKMNNWARHRLFLSLTFLLALVFLINKYFEYEEHLAAGDDVLLEIATIITDYELRIVARGPVLAIRQSEARLKAMNAWNRRTHGKSGLIERVRSEGELAGVLRATDCLAVDLRRRFGMPAAEFGPTTVVIVVRIGGQNDRKRTVGLVVDAVADVHDIDQEQIHSTPEFGGKISDNFVRGLGMIGEKMVILLEIDNLIDWKKVSGDDKDTATETLAA